MTKEELEKMTKEEIILEYISLLNFEQKVSMENNNHYGKIHELNEKLDKLEKKYDTLMKYTKHIQEYLCDDIMNLMKEEYDYED